ncbi:MAG: type VI secretion system Vgr family protein [Sandaracinaceae bacterium]
MDQVEASFLSDETPSVLWAVEGASVGTALNEPYLARIEIVTDQTMVDPLDLLGSSASLTLQRNLVSNVYGGLVSSVQLRHDHDGRPRARILVEPALAALRHTRDSRIFQEKTVPEVLGEVLEAALAPYGREAVIDLTRDYPKREYTVQYQESHFDFVHRLMEEEGIVYFFEPDDTGVERLVLIDTTKQHPAIESGMLEYSVVTSGGGVIAREYVRSFEPLSIVVGSSVRTRHFDWTHPSAMIEGENEGEREGVGPDGAALGPERESYQHDEPLTLHQYSQSYTAYDVKDQELLLRDAQVRDARRVQAESTVVGLRAGQNISLHGHPIVELNADYITVRGTHTYGSSATGGDTNYKNRFVVVPSDVLYRPRRTRARPRVHGIQTAIVTGPAGEEIHTDEHGRVKVQFHWDRLGEMDEKTTCWIRCMQTWAGKGWGAFVLPRVGMEVVVSFVDGDLDRPLVTGCVYNGDNPGPYDQPSKKMISTFKTNSYPGGNGYNELRFDDSKGAEEIWIHGEKDWNTVIENDLDRKVFHDETQHVSNNRRRNVGVNETVTVGSNRSKTVGANETLNVGANRSRSVGANESLSIGANRTKNVLKDEKSVIGENQKVRVGLTQSVYAGEEILIKCGPSAYIKMTKDGKVEIGGREFLFKATEDVFVEGAHIFLN